MIQLSNCNQSLLSGIAVVPNQIRTLLPDSVIDVARVRYLPVAIPPATPPPPTTLEKDDTVAMEFLRGSTLPASAGNPTNVLSVVRTAFIMAG